MYLSVGEHEETQWHKLVDVNTGEEIEYVVWADDELGDYGQYRRDRYGQLVIRDGSLIIDEKHGNIKLVDTREASPLGGRNS